MLKAGADKTSLNTAAVKNPGLLKEGAEKFGRQCMVLAVDARRAGDQKWEVYVNGGRTPTGLDCLEWVKKAVELGFADEVLFAEGEQEPEKGDEQTEGKDITTKVEAKMYSSRMMDQAILNRLGVNDELQPRAREEPMIGMDGKTKDGAMPYEILKTQLDFLK